ncbi:hypothetical protein AK812_SmicGene18661 [Symbiodinium microadriaticum]|uniref:Uncharacterized protein n=1 Tax=Symbiodinium microadriaticum TaxID=2951 RepID=A0A1Q9DUQ1_SYMMI|nr:hypothetical protein AK812_SmicGene18661 [Symbiodinium microadriaticum]
MFRIMRAAVRTASLRFTALGESDPDASCECICAYPCPPALVEQTGTGGGFVKHGCPFPAGSETAKGIACRLREADTRAMATFGKCSLDLCRILPGRELMPATGDDSASSFIASASRSRSLKRSARQARGSLLCLAQRSCCSSVKPDQLLRFVCLVGRQFVLLGRGALLGRPGTAEELGPLSRLECLVVTAVLHLALCQMRLAKALPFRMHSTLGHSQRCHLFTAASACSQRRERPWQRAGQHGWTHAVSSVFACAGS